MHETADNKISDLAEHYPGVVFDDPDVIDRAIEVLTERAAEARADGFDGARGGRRGAD